MRPIRIKIILEIVMANKKMGDVRINIKKNIPRRPTKPISSMSAFVFVNLIAK